MMYYIDSDLSFDLVPDVKVSRWHFWHLPSCEYDWARAMYFSFEQYPSDTFPIPDWTSLIYFQNLIDRL